MTINLHRRADEDVEAFTANYPIGKSGRDIRIHHELIA